MSKVFALTIVPGRRHRRELWVLSVSPGIARHLMQETHSNLEKLAERRKADLVLVRDVDVRYTESWLDRLTLWRLARKLKGWAP